jgi:FMN-dependent oxidoreductase (nitrilotriacetate monooxygenase family)
MRGIGYHPSGWRDPHVQLDGAIDIAHSIKVAQIAEKGMFDFVFLADQSALNFNDEPKGAFGRNQEGAGEFEPITLLAALSQAQNFGGDSIISRDQRYQRAKESIEVAFGLWECWEPDAYVRDRQRGLFFDPARLHRLEHKGAHFSVRGPLTMPRSPQGRPVIAQAGASADGIDFAASVADIIYAVQTRLEGARDFYAAMKARVAAKGRDPSDVKILPGFLPVVGSTMEEAQRKYRTMLSHLDPILGLERLSRFFGDLTSCDLDGPLPELRTDLPLVSRASLTLRLAREQNWSIRQLYEETIISHGHHVAIGTPETIADDMQTWVEQGAADGFNIVPALLPQSLTDFVDHVTPELQRRNLFRTEYESKTLRGHLGLSAVEPPNRN